MSSRTNSAMSGHVRTCTAGISGVRTRTDTDTPLRECPSVRPAHASHKLTASYSATTRTSRVPPNRSTSPRIMKTVPKMKPKNAAAPTIRPDPIVAPTAVAAASLSDARVIMSLVIFPDNASVDIGRATKSKPHSSEPLPQARLPVGARIQASSITANAQPSTMLLLPFSTKTAAIGEAARIAMIPIRKPASILDTRRTMTLRSLNFTNRAREKGSWKGSFPKVWHAGYAEPRHFTPQGKIEKGNPAFTANPAIPMRQKNEHFR